MSAPLLPTSKPKFQSFEYVKLRAYKQNVALNGVNMGCKKVILMAQVIPASQPRRPGGVVSNLLILKISAFALVYGFQVCFFSAK